MKSHRILTYPLAFGLLLAAALSSCENAASDQSSVSSSNETVLQNSLASGFNSIRELQSFGYNAAFYKAALNTDPQYISEGTSSAKFTFKGRDIYTPELKIYSDSGYFGNSDFTQADMITLDVYNPGEKDRTFVMMLTTSKDGNKTVYQNYTEKSFTVKPGHTLVTYGIDRSIAAAICDMKYVEYIDFRFQNDPEEYSLYFDDLHVYYTQEPLVIETKKYQENEILFFDNKLDRFSLQTVPYMSTSATLPELSICRDPRYIHQGNGSLKVSLPNTPGNMAIDETPCIRIDGEAVTRNDYTKYQSIQFDFLSEYDGGLLSVRLYNSLGAGIMFSPVNLNRSKKGQWMTMTISLQDAANGYISAWDGTKCEGIDIEHLSAIEIFYTHRPHQGQNFYLDALRLQ